MKNILIAITGASGAIYALQTITDILSFSEYMISIIYSENGKKVWEYELKKPILSNSERIKVFNNDDFFTPPASGSTNYEAMIIVPCTMGTLAKIANGISSNLIARAADVMLKEKKTLILVPRELPYNLIHIKNMAKLIQSGGIILPASPSFYNHPQTITDVIKSVTDRILKMINIPITINEWGK